MRDATFRVVSVIDPALDTGSLTFDEIQAYVTTRDFSIVDGKWVPGLTPTIFHVREVAHDLWATWVMSAATPEEKHLRCFIAGVSRVDNLVGEDGVALPSWQPAGKRGKHEMMTDKESERFAWQECEEIGSVIFQHSFLHRRMQLSLQLPSSVVEHLGRRVCRLAELSQNTAAATSSAEPSVSTEPTPSATENTSESSAAG